MEGERVGDTARAIIVVVGCAKLVRPDAPAVLGTQERGAVAVHGRADRVSDAHDYNRESAIVSTCEQVPSNLVGHFWHRVAIGCSGLPWQLILCGNRGRMVRKGERDRGRGREKGEEGDLEDIYRERCQSTCNGCCPMRSACGICLLTRDVCERRSRDSPVRGVCLCEVAVNGT